MPPLSRGGALGVLVKLLLAALLPLWLLSGGVWADETYTISVTQSVSGASAGAAFTQQPIVTIYDSSGEIATDYVGSVYVTLEGSPTGFEVLYFNGTDVSDDGYPGRVYFVDGLASFEGLYINDAGSGFMIEFIVLDDTDATVTSTESAEFEVSIGSAYQISLSTYPGSATGGSGFSPQPVVATKDIGGNTVSSYGEGQVTAYLVDTEQNPNPTGGELRGTTTRSMNNGLVTFTDLYINEAGSPYLLAFEFTGADLAGTTVVYSNPFAVGIGKAATMEMLETVTDGYTYGGVAFQIQPRIQVLDAGGNLLTGDSESIVEVSFTTNPSSGKMSPAEYTTETLVSGICSFALLSIDKIGNGYELLFTLKEYSSSTNSYTSNGITLSSASFDVTLGPPYELVVDTAPGGAAAGGSAFTTQPVVSLRDVGGNIITTDSTSVVTAIQVESLSTAKSITINTQSAPQVQVTDVYYSKEGGANPGGSATSFTAGDSLSLFVEFSQEVTVTPTKASPVLEFTALVNSTANTDSIHRHLTATCVTLSTVSKTLEFELQIPQSTDDGQSVFTLATTGQDALRLRDSQLLDNLDRSVNYTLPVEGEAGSLTNNVNITVDLRVPYVTGIELFMENSTEGIQTQMVSTSGLTLELGAGHLIAIQVTFSQPVFVSGTPVVPLNMTHRNESLMGTVDAVPPEQKIRHARYTSGSGTNVLTFEHTIRRGDMSSDLDMPEGVDGKNRSILLEGGYIRRYSMSPALSADLNLTSIATLGSLGDVVIDTMAPKVNLTRGVTTTAADGLYYAGDIVYLQVEFDKPVVATTGVYLELSTGLSAATQAYYYSGSGTRLLTFEYTVRDSEDINCMDVFGMNDANPGLFARGSQHIRRAATNLIGDADTSLVGARRLNQSSCLELYGVAPVVQEYYFNSRTANEQGENGTVYSIGDSVFINVTFDRPVVVLEDIKLFVYVTNIRAATYKSGNHSRTIVFEYAVQLGDTFTRSTSQSCIYCFKGIQALCTATKSRCAKTMGLRYSPNALVGTVQLDSTNPTVDADLTISGTDDYAGTKYGIPVYAYADSGGLDNSTIVQIDTENVRSSYITGVSCTKEPGTYGAGENIYFEVTYSDEITIYGASLPQLWMSTNAGATYYSGSGTDTWVFFYRTQEGDNSSSLGLMNYDYTDSFIKCNKTGITSFCSMVNGNSEELNLTTTNIGLGDEGNYIDTGVRIDTSAPKVVDVYTTKNTSRYPNQVYTVGEEIDVIVEFDLPLKVSGTPVLYLETGDDDTEVEYAGMDGLYKLIFKYTVDAGHMAGNLTYADTDAVFTLTAYRKKNALTTNYGQASIRRYASVATTDANLTLAQPPPPLARNGQVVTVDTSQIPKVINVTSSNDAGTYRPGDSIVISVEFDQLVEIDTNVPFINLELGTVDRKAYYRKGSGSRFLTFMYDVLPGDISYDLDYVDAHSMETGTLISGEQGTILQMSSNPTISADPYLPYVGAPGSLSYNNDIKIDGITPYIISTDFRNPDGAVLNMGDSAFIDVTFSAAVEVVGTPKIRLQIEAGSTSLKRFATYLNGTNTSVLTFEYVVQTGDDASRLDYYADENLFRSSAASFNTADGTVLLLSSNSTLEADLHLNPAGGFLDGTQAMTLSLGVASFEDLQIVQRGPNYKLLFTIMPQDIDPHLLKTETSIEVEYSAEFEMMGSDREEGDYFGYAVDVEGDIVMVGAPHKHLDLEEVQYIRTAGTAPEPITEVQVIGVSAVHQDEIQSFTTYCDPNERVQGGFRLGFVVEGVESDSFQTTRTIPASTLPESLEQYLMEDIPSLGLMKVSREVYEWCACDNGYVWSVTFMGLRGEVKTMTTFSELTGPGATITEASVVTNSTEISGTFQLTYGYQEGDDLNHPDLGKKLTTRELSYDSDNEVMRIALEQDLKLPVYEIHVADVDPQGGRKWIVTFDDHYHPNGTDTNITARSSLGVAELDNDLAELGSVQPNLKGHKAHVWHYTARNGSNPIWGHFRLAFRDSGWTPKLPFDASAKLVEEELEKLATIGDVDVSRGPVTPEGGYLWTVVFNSFYVNTIYGYTEDDHGNLEPLQVDGDGILKGTEATIEVGAITGKGKLDYPNWAPKRMGSFGEEAGAIYMFVRTGISKDQYVQTHSFRADDTDKMDHFGASVKMDHANYRLLVGAPSKDDNGVFEQQGMVCKADGGYFTLTFRGFSSDPIPWNVTTAELLVLMEHSFGTCLSCHDGATADPMHPFPEGSLDISSWTGGLCSKTATKDTSSKFYNGTNQAIVTFRAPAGDLEALGVDVSNLELDGVLGAGSGANVTIWEKVKGTSQPHGVDATGAQKGAAYFFEPVDTEASPLVWKQAQKIMRPDGESFDRFGERVTVEGTTAVISAPGEEQDRGAVYVYEYDSSLDEFVESQRLTSSVWSYEERDHFGFSLSVTEGGDTIAVGAPGYGNESGAVYTFRRSESSGLFMADQKLALDMSGDELEQPAKGDRLGCSVAVNADTVVAGACGRDDFAIYTGTIPSATRVVDSGAAFVFVRDGSDFPFEYSEKLIASNVKTKDQFGHAVALSNNTAVVSSLQQPPKRQHLRPRHAVQAITTHCTPMSATDKVGSVFRLGWKYQMEGNDLWTITVSDPIESDASTTDFEAILEDLGTGDVRVSRTKVDPITGGYTWYVTFVEDDSWRFRESPKPVMIPYYDTLTGTNARVTVTSVVSNPMKVRGVVHVFTRTDKDEYFTEQSYLYPASPQKQDLFGAAVAINGDLAVVGAYNRDTYVSGTNAGSVLAYNLNFLTCYFDTPTYEVDEGSGVYVAFERDTALDSLLVLKLASLDRNADPTAQKYASEVFDITYVDKGVTVTDYVGAGTAFGRAQYYGSDENRSIWVDAQYDYRGISDYLPINEPLVFFSGNSRLAFALNTSSDAIVETPDENMTVMLKMPGVWGSVLGDLSSVVTIKDDADGTGAVSLVTYFDKVYASDIEMRDEFGSAVAVNDEDNVAVVGAPMATRNRKHSRYEDEDDKVQDTMVGAAYVFRRWSGVWEQEARLLAWGRNSSNTSLSKAYFGDSVAVSKAYGRNHTTILVGSPGTAQVFVYEANSTMKNHERVGNETNEAGGWENVAILTHPEAKYPQHRYGTRGAIAIDQDVAVVGAAGLECVFVFRRNFNKQTLSWEWQSGEKIVSEEYDYDYILGRTYIHKQDFGISVSTHKRTFVVGAPHADYGNQGETDLRETYDTDGVYNAGLGKGKVFAFYSAPSTQVIKVRGSSALYAGTFKLSLSHRNTTDETGELDFNAQDASVEAALEGLENVDDVEVTYAATKNGYSWTVSFLSENEAPPLLEASWRGRGCSSCTNFSSSWDIDPTTQVHIQLLNGVGSFVQSAALQAQDAASADRFGYSVAMQYDQVIVGAPHSSVRTTTTWDFETGDLIGWVKTGTAFDYQPTWGDNSLGRSVYGGIGDRRSHGAKQHTYLRGRYYVGTFEKRPGNGRDDYMNPHPDYTQGTSQGDGPVGTLTSQPFMIEGDHISFLIGGGCDHLVEYVELLVDGIAMARATGKCEERMLNTTWDVSLFRNRAAQIRIVDQGSSIWGHINVDQFVFDWVVKGGEMSNPGQNIHRSAPTVTPLAGAAYAFRRLDNASEDVCTGDKQYCAWAEEGKLMASDRREGDMLGYAVAVDDDQGTAIVSALKATARSVHALDMSNYPHYSTTAVDLPMLELKGLDARTKLTRSLLPGASRMMLNQMSMDRTSLPNAFPNGEDIFVDLTVARGPRMFDDSYYEESGAVYLFRRINAVYGGLGDLVTPPIWPPMEQMKILPPEIKARDSFGQSVAISGTTTFIGANGDDAMTQNAGAAYTMDVGLQRVYFRQAEFYGTEGTDSYVTIYLDRDEDYADEALTVAYATSDLTAKGVDTKKFAACMDSVLANREGCGDYLQAAGEVTFTAGATSALFVIYLINDKCLEHYQEYLQLTLSVPGGSAAIGEDYVAKLRIDDDDFTENECDHRFL